MVRSTFRPGIEKQASNELAYAEEAPLSETERTSLQLFGARLGGRDHRRYVLVQQHETQPALVSPVAQPTRQVDLLASDVPWERLPGKHAMTSGNESVHAPGGVTTSIHLERSLDAVSLK